MAKKSKSERLQVPVNGDLARAITKLGQGLDRSTAWLAANLLEFSLRDRKHFADWVGLAFIGEAYDTIRKLAGRKSSKYPDGQDVRLQFSVPHEVMAELQKLAEELNQSPVQVAGMLLASSVHHHRIFLDAIGVSKRAIQAIGVTTRSVKTNLVPSLY